MGVIYISDVFSTFKRFWKLFLFSFVIFMSFAYNFLLEDKIRYTVRYDFSINQEVKLVADFVNVLDFNSIANIELKKMFEDVAAVSKVSRFHSHKFEYIVDTYNPSQLNGTDFSNKEFDVNKLNKNIKERISSRLTSDLDILLSISAKQDEVNSTLRRKLELHQTALSVLMSVGDYAELSEVTASPISNKFKNIVKMTLYTLLYFVLLIIFIVSATIYNKVKSK